MLTSRLLPIGPPLPAVVTIVPAPPALSRHHLLWRTSAPSRNTAGAERHGLPVALSPGNP